MSAEWELVDGLAVHTRGAGPSILLMPYPHAVSVVGDPTMDALINPLVALGRRVVTFDPPGSGRSTCPPRLGMRKMLACAETALDVTGVNQPVDVLGHSQGGMAALAFALDHPHMIRRLVLVGTAASGISYFRASGAIWKRDHPDWWRMGLWALLYRLSGRRAPALRMLDVIQRASWVDQARYSPRRVTLVDWLRAAPPRMAWGLVARRLDYRDQLAELCAPTLVLVGKRDPQMPLACAEELSRGIPHARLVVFSHSGHYPFLEEADPFWATVAEFLNASPTSLMC